jgi:hypothetical protein
MGVQLSLMSLIRIQQVRSDYGGEGKVLTDTHLLVEPTGIVKVLDRLRIEHADWS